MRKLGAVFTALMALGASLSAAQVPRGLPAAMSQLAPGPSVTPSGAAVSDPNATSAAHSLEKADLDAWLDGYMPYALRSADIPGSVVVVVKNGQIVTARGFGYADLAKRTRVDPEKTLFRIGSVSKLFTWTATMQLVEQGKLDLDGDINRYLDFTIPPRDGKPVTLRQLMTHTGGFEDVARGVVFHDPHRFVSLGAYLKRYSPARIFPPGTTPAYSNWATALAGYIVQRVSGEPFELYLERHIFSPLGMKNATFRQPLPANLAAQMATGYSPVSEPEPFEYVGPWPAGSAAISGTDMARFMIAHLQKGAFQGQRILKPETADVMHDSPLSKVDPISLMPPLNRMELGFFETNVNGREVIGHLGDTSAFHTSLHLFMKDGVGLYVSFNSPGKGGAVQALRTGVFDDFADRYFPNIAGPQGRVDARTAAAHASLMAGNWIASRRIDTSFLAAGYWLAGQAKVTTDAQGGLLIPSVVNAAGRPRQWVETAPFVWQDKFGHDRLAAKVVNGEVVRWTFDLAAPFEVFERVPASRSAVWLLPALYASLAVLLFTLLWWPTAAVVRRRYAAAMPLAGERLRAYRASRVMAGFTFALLVTWAITIVTMLGSADALAGGYDGFVWFLEIAGVVIFFGAPVIAAWNLWVVWQDGRRWLRVAWSALLLLATLIPLYVALQFSLVALTVNY